MKKNQHPIWSFVQSIGAQGLSFLFFVVLARLLAPEQYGMMAQLMIYVSIGNLLIEQGLETAIVQRKELLQEHLMAAFTINVVIALICVIPVLAANTWVATMLGNPELTKYLPLLALNLIFSSLQSVPMALLRRHGQYKDLALMQVIGLVCGGSLGLYMAANGFGLWSLIVNQLVSAMLMLGRLWWLSDWRPSLIINFGAVKEMLAFSRSMLGLKVLDLLDQRLDQYMIGRIFGSAMLGQYAVTVRIYRSLIDVIYGALNRVSFPNLSRANAIGKERIRSYLKNFVLLTSTGAAIPFFVGSMLVGHILPLVFGNKWEAAGEFSRLMLLIGIVWSVSAPLGESIVAGGRPAMRLLINSIHISANILIFVFASRLGAKTTITLYVTRGLILMPLEIWAAHKVNGFRWRDLVPMLPLPYGLCALAIYLAWVPVPDFYRVPVVDYSLAALAGGYWVFKMLKFRRAGVVSAFTAIPS